MTTNKNNSGFTLIETVIYIALFAIIIGGGLLATYGIIEGSDKTNARSIVEQEGMFVIRKLNWAMTGATAASATATTLSITNGSTLTFALTGTTLEMNNLPLTSLNVKASSVSFQDIASSGTRPEAIKASFWLTGTKGNSQYFETIKYLR